MTLPSIPSVALALLAIAPLAAQTASYRIVGTSCTTGRISQHIGPVPLIARGVPRIGSTFTIETECSSGYPWGTRRIVHLLTGASNTAVGGVSLPFDIATLRPGEPWCGILRTSNEIVIPVPTQPLHTIPAVVQIPVPNTPALAGLPFYQQVVSVEASSFGPPFSSVALSAGGEGIIGF